MTGARPGRVRWLVDGMNVIGSRPDGWWRDRPAAWRRLARDLGRFADASGQEVSLVLDGRRPANWESPEGVDVAFAAGGRGAADDAIVARVADDPEPASLRVVTSDRELARRVTDLGAEVAASSAFRQRLEH
jgi:predicted RNA-binding protein with PIN domain